MNIFEEVSIYVEGLSVFGDWPEMADLYRRKAKLKPHGWDLSAVACGAVGGTMRQAVPAVAAVGCLQMSILLVDDILDEDPHGAYQQMGEGRAANLATALHAAGMEILLECDAPPQTRSAMAVSASRMMSRTAYGQELDVHNPDTEEAYWEMVKGKSSPYHQSVLEIGALIGGASPEVVAAIAHFGDVYGEIVQIHDDFKDTMAVPAGPDWILGRLPLPVLFAHVVDHPEKDQFIDLRQEIQAGAGEDILRQAQQILIRSGAISYTLEQMLVRYMNVESIFAEINLENPKIFNSLLEDIIKPAQALFAEIGYEAPFTELIQG